MEPNRKYLLKLSCLYKCSKKSKEWSAKNHSVSDNAIISISCFLYGWTVFQGFSWLSNQYTYKQFNWIYKSYFNCVFLMWNPMLNIVFPILVVGYQEISSVWYVVIMFQSINQLSYFSGGFLMCRISCWSSFIVEWRLANSWLRPWVEVCSILRASLWTKWRPVFKLVSIEWNHSTILFVAFPRA